MYAPEDITMVIQSTSGGQVWLGGLPLEKDSLWWKRHRFSLQIHCNKKRPQETGIENKDTRVYEKGHHISGTLLKRLNMDNPSETLNDWQEVVIAVGNSVHQGDKVPVHCMAGKHRASAASILLRAILCGETTQQAWKKIGARRKNSPKDILLKLGEPRMHVITSFRLPESFDTKPTGWVLMGNIIRATSRSTSSSQPHGRNTLICDRYTAHHLVFPDSNVHSDLGKIVKNASGTANSHSLCRRCRGSIPSSFTLQAIAAKLI